MRTYVVRTLYKKSFNVYETWIHPDKEDKIIIEENYRWGYWEITPADDEEEKLLLDCCDAEAEYTPEFNPDDYENCEMIEMDDLCYREGRVMSNTMTDEEQEKLEEETEYFDWAELENRGWYIDDIEYSIDCPMFIEDEKENVQLH